MGIKELNVISILVGVIGFFYSQSLVAQEENDPKIIHENRFNLAMRINAPRVFAMSPYGNVDSVKYEGYYAVLKVHNGKVSEIFYPIEIKQLITRLGDFAKKDINERIDLGEFELVNIDQIVVPAIVEYIHYETEDIRLDEVLEKILPKTGFTSGTYILSPVVMRIGNPKRRSN